MHQKFTHLKTNVQQIFYFGQKNGMCAHEKVSLLTSLVHAKSIKVPIILKLNLTG